MGEKGVCQKAKIALGGVGPTPIRARAAEDLLAGKAITEALMAEAGVKAAEAAEPEADYHASAEYRRDMARVYTVRSLKAAWNMVKGGK
jgi:carbon-monoxide dehydrogenase medium subunit